jgi:Activator of Hsp90 ATPase homolog 1-like protein
VLKFDDGDERGTITELREPQLLAYTWNEGETDSLVRFELELDGDGTRLMLRHTFEGEVDVSSYGGGWHHHLEQLVAEMAGTPIAWDSMRYRELKSEYERRAQHLREAELVKEH